MQEILQPTRSESLDGLAAAMRGDRIEQLLRTHDLEGQATSMPIGVLSRFAGESRLSRSMTVALVAAIGLLIVRPVAMSLLSYHRTATLLDERRSEVRSLAERHSQLRSTLEYYRSDVFLMERARRYGLARPGERTYVVRELANPNRLNGGNPTARRSPR